VKKVYHGRGQGVYTDVKDIQFRDTPHNDPRLKQVFLHIVNFFHTFCDE